MPHARVAPLARIVLHLAFAGAFAGVLAACSVDPYAEAVPSPAYVPPPVPYVEGPSYGPGTAFLDPAPAYRGAPSPGYRYPAPAYVTPSPYAAPYVAAAPAPAYAPALVPPGYGPPGVVTGYPASPDRTGYCSQALAEAADASNRAAVTGSALDADRAQRTAEFYRRDC